MNVPFRLNLIGLSETLSWQAPLPPPSWWTLKTHEGFSRASKWKLVSRDNNMNSRAHRTFWAKGFGKNATFPIWRMESATVILISHRPKGTIALGTHNLSTPTCGTIGGITECNEKKNFRPGHTSSLNPSRASGLRRKLAMQVQSTLVSISSHQKAMS